MILLLLADSPIQFWIDVLLQEKQHEYNPFLIHLDSMVIRLVR